MSAKIETFYERTNMLCKDVLLGRALDEYIAAKKERPPNDALIQGKLKALLILRLYGWTTVFEGSLNETKTGFKSQDEWARFGFCQFSESLK
jgi:hypothetical protein